MTRSEFIQNIETLSDLFDFCYDNDITEITEDVYTEEELQSYVVSEARDYAVEYGWVELRHALDSIADGYDYYRRTGYMEFEEICSSEFEDLKEQTLSLCDEDYDVWDEEETSEELLPESQTDEEPIPEENITTADLFMSAHQMYVERKPKADNNDKVECKCEEENEENGNDPRGFFFF